MKKINDDNPMFNMLFYPEREEILADTLKCGIDMIQKRYGIDNRIFQLLRETNDDKIRKFAVLFILAWEKPLADGIAEHQPDKNHYHAFLTKMLQWVDHFCLRNYSDVNIDATVEEFVRIAKFEWTMGPL